MIVQVLHLKVAYSKLLHQLNYTVNVNDTHC